MLGVDDEDPSAERPPIDFEVVVELSAKPPEVSPVACASHT